MRLNDESMQTAREVFLKNPFWLKIWNGAPEGARRRLNLSFWFSVYKDESSEEEIDAYRNLRCEVEDSLSLEDLRYLIANDTNKEAQRHFRDLYLRRQFRDLYTVETLDEAAERLMSGLSPTDYGICQKAQQQLWQCDDPLVKYEWFWKALGGDAKACLLLGDVFSHGHGVAENLDSAVFWYRRGAFSGDGECCAHLAAVYEDERSRLFNFDAAQFWFQEGIRRGSVVARCQFAYRIVRGSGVWTRKRDPFLGVEILRTCTDEDKHGFADYFLAQCLEEGLGTERDLAAAIHHYEQANKKGHCCAKGELERLRAAMPVEH